MKTHKNSPIIFLVVFSLIFIYSASLVFAQEGNGNQNMSHQEGPGNHQQNPSDPSDNTNPMGEHEGVQGGGNNQNNSGQHQGSNNENCSEGKQYRHRYQSRYTMMDGVGNYTRMRSQCRGNATNESFEIFFSIDDAPTLELSYFTDINATNGQHHFSLVIEQLVEYNDVNSNGKYDHNDIILSSLLMSNVTFTNITYTNSTTPDGKTITIIETHTTDNLFFITIYLVSERTTFLNNTITPKEIKIDFKIIDYLFVNQTSQLALITQLETPFVITPEQSTHDEKQGTAFKESGLSISSANRIGFFTWADDVLVDNVKHTVNVTVISKTEQILPGDNQERYTQTQVIFSYPRGESIIHDPKIGVIDFVESVFPSVLQSEYISIVYLFACIVSGIVFCGIVYFRKKL